MAVADAGWWSVWWLWLLMWSMAAIGLLTLAGFAVRCALDRRGSGVDGRAAAVLRGRKILYRDLERVRALHDDLEGRIALRHRRKLNHEVEERHRRGGAARASTTSSVELAVEAGRETVERFNVDDRHPERMMVALIRELDRADGIVHLDLLPEGARSASPEAYVVNRSLAQALVARSGGPRSREMSLSGAGGYFLLIDGELRRARTPTGGQYVIVADLGVEAPGGGPAPSIQFDCDEPPSPRAFAETSRRQALCRYRRWDAATATHHVEPVVIFG